MTLTLPNLIIAGAPKAGTTALWGYLSEHPDIYMSQVKEPHFFTRDATQPAPGVKMVGPKRVCTWERGLEWYASLFEEGAGRKVRGEASTHYLVCQDSPNLIYNAIPDVKIIFLLRDPVERAYSHYWQDWKQGWNMPPFSAILDDAPELRYYRLASSYSLTLPKFIDKFTSKNIKIISFDQLKRDPQEALRQVYNFLGVNSKFDIKFNKAFNPNFVPKWRGLERLTTRSKHLPVRRYIPPPAKHVLKKIRGMIEAHNRSIQDYPDLSDEVYTHLAALFREDIIYAERMLGPLPSWGKGVR